MIFSFFFTFLIVLIRLNHVYGGAANPSTRYEWKQCNDGYYVYGPACFGKTATASYTYYQAVNACRSVVSGSTLAKITDSTMNTFVFQNLIQGGATSYIGAYKYDNVATHFRWAYDGSEVTYGNWGPTQPDHWNQQEGCIEVSGSSGAWNDISCNTGSHHGICYYHYETPVNTASCSLSTLNGLQSNIIQKLVSQGDLVVPSKWQSETSGYAGAFAPDAAASLDKIATRINLNGTFNYEYAYQTPIADYVVDRWISSNYCSNRNRKQFSEDPITREHNTGCAMDLSAEEAAKWSDELVSKGWVYSRPTIYKHHFEFLKCREVSVETGIRAYQTVWNENVDVGDEIPVTGELDAATLYTLGEVTCAGFQVAPTAQPTLAPTPSGTILG